MSRIRRYGSFVVVVASLVFGALGLTGQYAGANSATNTTNSTNTLISAKCYRHHSNTTTNFSWSSTLRRYQVYSSAHHSTSDYTKCHS